LDMHLHQPVGIARHQGGFALSPRSKRTPHSVAKAALASAASVRSARRSIGLPEGHLPGRQFFQHQDVVDDRQQSVAVAPRDADHPRCVFAEIAGDPDSSSRKRPLDRSQRRAQLVTDGRDRTQA
jgi:hypothetical protein